MLFYFTYTHVGGKPTNLTAFCSSDALSDLAIMKLYLDSSFSSLRSYLLSKFWSECVNLDFWLCHFVYVTSSFNKEADYCR